jgi:hypothetical protein
MSMTRRWRTCRVTVTTCETVPALLLFRTKRKETMHAMRLVFLLRTGRKMMWMTMGFISVAIGFAIADEYDVALLFAIAALCVI